jgi:hypothetical protein
MLTDQIRAAISLRHPIFLRWNPYVEECLDILANNPNPAPDDVWLGDLMRLHRINEDAHFFFSMDDPASTVSLRDPKVQYHLLGLEQQLDRWQKEAKSPMTSFRARLCSANVNVYIHELALHSHLHIDVLRSPPDVEELSKFLSDLDIGPVRMDSLCACAASTHNYFETLLGLDIPTLRSLPNMYFVRSGYCAIVLKLIHDLHIESMSPRSQHSSSASDSASDRSQPILGDVKFDHYMEKMINLYAEVGKDGKSNIATSFYHALRMIKNVKIASVVAADTSPPPQTQTRRMPQSDPTLQSTPDRVLTAQAPVLPQAEDSLPYNLSSSNNIGMAPDIDWNLSELDANMFDINSSSANVMDPSFATLGFWNLAGWNDVNMN